MRINTFLSSSLVACLLTTIPCAASADAVFGDFKIANGVPSVSGGRVEFSLNSNGTIGAKLTSISNIIGFGFDSATTHLPESDFSPGEPVNLSGWVDMYGFHSSGFAAPAANTTITWTIGNIGQFRSVYDVLSGAGSIYDFFLFTADEKQWAANAEPLVSGVPEPGSLTILGLGLAGLAAMRRRKA